MGTAYRNLGLAALARGDFIKARSMLEESLHVFSDIVIGWDIVRSLDYLGRVSMASGDIPEAKKFYLEALHLALEVQTSPLVMDVMLGFARLQTQEGKFEPALTLSSWVLKDPASTQETKDAASQFSALVG